MCGWTYGYDPAAVHIQHFDPGNDSRRGTKVDGKEVRSWIGMDPEDAGRFRSCLYSDSKGCGCTGTRCYSLGRIVSLSDCIRCLSKEPKSDAN